MERPEPLPQPRAAALIRKVSKTVRGIMSNKPFDASHDYDHIERVLDLTKTLTASEASLHPDIELDTLIITLTALLHDICDSKYVVEEGVRFSTPTPQSVLLNHKAPIDLATTIQLLTTNVSCSKEKKNPEEMDKIIAVYPELAIVQDADRLDALGAVGVARAFVFNGVRGSPLADARDVLDTHLLPREGMMRTTLGKRMAADRCSFVREFVAHWDLEESGFELEALPTLKQGESLPPEEEDGDAGDLFDA